MEKRHKMTICDEQNESELGKNENLVFNCHICLIVGTIYSLVKTALKLDLWFQKYHHFNAAQNNQIQRKLNAIIYCILKSILLDYITFFYYLHKFGGQRELLIDMISSVLNSCVVLTTKGMRLNLNCGV